LRKYAAGVEPVSRRNA